MNGNRIIVNDCNTITQFSEQNTIKLIISCFCGRLTAYSFSERSIRKTYFDDRRMDSLNDVLRKKAQGLPLLPGVYMMKDDESQVIYVGKAARLKNRVSSYFVGAHDTKTEALISNIDDFDAIIVESEFEALVLENSLIKEYMPKYNIKLRDDKGYPVIRIDIKSKYPALKIVTRAEDDDALYLGPYGGRSDTRKAVAAVSKALKLPTCGKKIGNIIGKERACLNFDMGNCRGYCQKSEFASDYRDAINAAIDVLQGKTASLIKKLTKEMTEASNALRFEVAAILRDRIAAIRVLEKKQFFAEEPIEVYEALYAEKTLKTHEWLKNALRLDSTPSRIEAFDISNTGSSSIVASMVVFVRGKPVKGEYRRFKIRTRKNQDDYGSMAEVVSRRFKRYLAEDEKFSKPPDIIFVDGGANHASVARGVLQELDLNFPVFGMVKDDRHKTRALVTPDGEEIGLAANPAVFALVGTIQEETHRFAVDYHRTLRSKEMLGK